MSEFTKNTEKRIEQLVRYALELNSGKNGLELIKKYQMVIDQLMPSDLVVVFDRLMKEDIVISDLKSLANKILNVFYKSVNEYPTITAKKDSLIDLLIQDNAILSTKLSALKPEIKQFNKNPQLLKDKDYLQTLLKQFTDLQQFTAHYTAKENILFPIVEQKWEHYRCVQLMWSYHDDIRKYLKQIVDTIQNKDIELKTFNRLIGDLFFTMYAIVFREDKILFPTILETIPEATLQDALMGLKDIGLAYIKTDFIIGKNKSIETTAEGTVDLGTGLVSIEQLKLIFNHLPVDITYVDENDEVRYFSTPKHRIFPRTIAVIGRKVHHCHPPESVHIVEKIVESFKNKTKDVASFWIKMGPHFVLIKYFAVRNENGNYKGVLEVSQEISEIKALEGERRLLDW